MGLIVKEASQQNFTNAQEHCTEITQPFLEVKKCPAERGGMQVLSRQGRARQEPLAAVAKVVFLEKQAKGEGPRPVPPTHRWELS